MTEHALLGGTMRPVMSAAALLALAPGCDPCHGWEEIVYVDAAAKDDGEAMDTVKAAVAQLRAWTGRETTCVDRVRLVEDLETWGKASGGRYANLTGNIAIDWAKNESRLEHRTLHEFCHSIDYEEGLPSLDNADILAPWAEDVSHEAYDTEEKRTKEAFANLCAEGPLLHPLWRQYVEHCGDEAIDPARRMVHELLYWQWDSDATIGDFEGSIELWEIGGLDDFGFARAPNIVSPTFVAGADALVALDMLYQTDEDGGFAYWQPVLRRLDPESASVLESMLLEPSEVMYRDYQNNPILRSHELLGSSADPILYDRAWPGEAWRVHGDPLEIEPIAFPRLPGGAILTGFEHQGRALVRVQAAEIDGIYGASLKDGAWTPVDLGAEPNLADATLLAFEADAEGGALLLNDDEGLSVAAIDYDGRMLWHRALGCANCAAHQLNRQPDGSVVVSASISLGGFERGWFPLRYDPATDTVSAPTNDCGTIRYHMDSVGFEGGQWGVLIPWLGDDYGPLSLLRLEVQPL